MVAIFLSLWSLFSLHSTDASAVLLQDTVKRHSHRQTVVADTAARLLTINKIYLVGNRITRDRIILRELSLKSGDLVSSTDLPGILERDQKKLINTRLFNTATIRTLELEPGKTDLLVDVNERWYTFPAPIFELADRNFNEWWQNYDHDLKRVNYGLRLYQYNMRGRNESLRFLAQFGFVRRFDLSYRFPYIDRKQKQGLVIDVDFSETKNLAYRTADHKLLYLTSSHILKTTRGAGITYTFRKSFYETHALRVEYRNNKIADTIAFLNPTYLGDEKKRQHYGSVSYQFTSDHRDYVGYPLKGYYIATSILKSGITANDDLNKTEINLNLAGFLDLKKGFFLSENLVTYWSTPVSSIPYSNFGAMGYRKQIVRGYEVYVIEGPRFFLNKTTFKKRIFSRIYHWKAMPIPQFRHIPLSIYIKTYGDAGYVQNYPNYTISSRLANTWLSSVGCGLDIVGSYDAVLRFEYTYNAEGQRGFFFHFKKEF